MQKKKILWLYQNLEKYEFANAQALTFKNAFSSLAITESSLENDDVLASALSYYDKFANNFYNNVLGYQNGFANKAITAREMDCYFVNFGGELVTIGCLRAQRPVESVSVIEQYLVQCKESSATEKDTIIAKWKKISVEFSSRYAQIKDDKNPSKTKAIVLTVLVVLNVVIAVFALAAGLLGMELPSELGMIPLLIIAAMTLGFSVWPIMCVIKEFKLLSHRDTVFSVVNTLGSEIERAEAILTQSIIKNYEILSNASRRGENFAVAKSTSTKLIEDINAKVKETYDYLKKTDSERTGIKAAVITLTAVIAVIIPLICFSPVLSAFSGSGTAEQIEENDKKEDDEDNDRDDDDDDDGGVPPVVINEIDSTVVGNIISDNSSYTDFGIYVKNLENGYEFGYNEDDEFLASAMAQIVILDTLANVVDSNSIDIDEETLLFTYLPNGKEAPDSPSQDGADLTIKECIEDVAVYGDNNKSNHLVDYIAQVTNRSSGFDYINNFMQGKGYNGTKTNRKTFVNPDYVDYTVEANATTPEEIANIFADLVSGEKLGSEDYIKSIFKSLDGNGQAMGLKKFVSSYYDVCNVNALTARSTNNVAIIERDGKQLLVAILSSTQEDKTNIETDEDRCEVQDQLIDYIVETQFEN